jgi:predicted transposase/invertase (TIGR01784 family)
MRNGNGGGILPLKSDIIFKLVFGDEGNTDILRSFLESALPFPEGDFGEITVMDPSLGLEFPGGKRGVLDVRIKTRAGIFVDVEIQLFKKRHMRERIMFYTAKESLIDSF